MVPRAACRSLLVAILIAAPMAAAGAPAHAPGSAPAASSAAAGDKPYTVVDGNKVDPATLKGFRAWRAAACDRCHGPEQEGLVGPSLIDSLKVLSKDEFKTTVRDGRLDKGMPAFGENPAVAENLDNLYAYLKGRSDGAITSARVVAAP